MPARSITSIDRDLSEAVKARASATRSIQQHSDAVVYNTRKIRELLDERLSVTVPDTLEQLLAPTAAGTPTSPDRGK